MTPNSTPLYYCICMVMGAHIVVVRMNLGPLFPSSKATCGIVGAGGNSVDAVPYLMACPERAFCVLRAARGRGRDSSLVT